MTMLKAIKTFTAFIASLNITSGMKTNLSTCTFYGVTYGTKINVHAKFCGCVKKYNLKIKRVCE